MTRFPDDFLWGAATAAHQVEGNNVNSDWWRREHSGDPTITEPSGDAADSYHRYAEDMELLSASGLNTYRFSIEWARIEPERGFVSHAELAHYRRMIDTAVSFGLEPVVTLVHFSIPQWFEDEGGWHSPDAVSRFEGYVRAVTPILASDVNYVCTINEPNIAAMMDTQRQLRQKGTLTAAGLPDPDPVVSEVLAECHRRAVDVLSELPGLKTGWTVATQSFIATNEEGAREKAAELAHQREEWFLQQAQGDDFIGVQAYTRNFVGPEGTRRPDHTVERTLTGWEYFPAAIENGIRSAWTHSQHVPVLVTENGIATADDTRRIDYVRSALQAVSRAMTDGVDVYGYIYWSALDNFEWAAGYSPTFGLIAFDPQTFERKPKDSLTWLGDVARNSEI